MWDRLFAQGIVPFFSYEKYEIREAQVMFHHEWLISPYHWCATRTVIKCTPQRDPTVALPERKNYSIKRALFFDWLTIIPTRSRAQLRDCETVISLLKCSEEMEGIGKYMKSLCCRRVDREFETIRNDFLATNSRPGSSRLFVALKMFLGWDGGGISCTQ